MLPGIEGAAGPSGGPGGPDGVLVCGAFSNVIGALSLTQI